MALNPYIHLDNCSQYIKIWALYSSKASVLMKQAMEKILPTKAALLQHSKHAAYQACVWTTSDRAEQYKPVRARDLG